MVNAAFVAPLLRQNTSRFIRAFAELPGVRLGVITMDDPATVDGRLREKIAAFVRVGNPMDPEHIARAGWELKNRLGGLDVLTGSLEELQIPVAIARDRLGLPGISEQVARNFREKSRMKQVLRGAGLPVARHALVTTLDDARRFVGDVGYPIVAKPPAGLGARATFRVTDDDELVAALRSLSAGPGNPVQCEEFIVARENTCETVMVRGEAVWHSGTHYMNAPLEVLENAWMQYCVLLPKEEEPEFTRFHAVNDAALQALGLETGLAHLEWFVRPDGRPVINEVGARPPGVNIMPLMSIVFDVDMISKWAELMTFGRFTPPRRRCAAGTAYFRGVGSGRVVAVHGLDQAQEEVGRYVVARKLPEIGQEKSASYEGEGWAIVKADDTRTAIHALQRLITLVRVEYA